MTRARTGYPWGVKRLAAGLAAAVLALTACDPIDVGAPAPAPPAQPPPDAAALFGKLLVAEEDTGAHYDREDWGEDWADHGGGCDTRDIVLLEQARGAQRGDGCAPRCPAGARPCWVSPYDGRATTDPGELEIDHRVSLKEASRSRIIEPGGRPGPGAARVWTAAQRAAFHDDRANLVAVTAGVNQGKSDEDAGDWKPADRTAWCDFATRYAQTKVAYRLTVDQVEHDGLAQMFATCPK